MMEHRPMDPYEQQLLKVFDRYDHDNCGSLDRDGLVQLCQTLQLEEQANVLIKNLLQETKQTRATFTEFKEALVALLGNIHSQRTTEEDSFKTPSPEREVSPKFVFGSKKYGRRSRPRGNDITEQNENIFTNKSNFNVPLQKSNSQSDVLFVKKRKTNNKLKRCTSFPGNRDYEYNNAFENNCQPSNHTISADTEFICTEEMLREAWRKLGVGEDGYLNQTELILVCDAIGLHKLADGVLRQLSNKLNLDYDQKISFQELFEALQQDDAWSEVLNSDTPVLETSNMSVTCLSDEIFKYITLGPDGTGLINTDTIIEMWETAGITSPKLLLSDLGFNDNVLNINELATVLDREIKSINEIRPDYQSPQIALLQASLTLYQTEIKCLKTILEQMHAEREKLKCDVTEANNRATLLAQEVDDNHTRMEQSAQNQVRLLEHRHADILKELTDQYNGEKEHMSLLNKNLEQKIACLENEETKLRNDLQLTQNYMNSLETENQNLRGEINELHKREVALTKEIDLLETEKQKRGEYEKEQLEPLLTKLSTLQLENAKLRDKNDEMLSEIEHLNSQITTLRPKISSTPMCKEYDLALTTTAGDTVGLGAKRRNDESPSKELSAFSLGDASPRLGKVRKFHKNKDPFLSTESGFDIELDGVESLSVSGNENDEIARLNDRITTLEKILTQHSIPLPALNNSSNSNLESERRSGENLSVVMQLKNYCKCLEKILYELVSKVEKLQTKDACENCEYFKGLNAKLNKFKLEFKTNVDDDTIETNFIIDKLLMLDASTNTDDDTGLKNNAIEELESKCNELENCIELLKNEYERCEDYWATKLDEERQMFEQEQNQSSEKLTELFGKIAEYEAQFAQQATIDNRLPPIEETYNLEKQFTDLEQEYEEFRAIAEQEIFDKDNELAVLKEKIKENQTTEASTQVNLDFKTSNLSNHVIESTNLFSADTLPYNWSDHQQYPTDLESLDNESEEQKMPLNVPYNLFNIPTTSEQSNKTTPCRPKRTRKYDRNPLSSQRLANKKAVQEKAINDDTMQSKWKETQETHKGDEVCVVSVTTLNNLNGRVHQLERNCRYLQMVLKQHHLQAEQLLHRKY